jgi:hypothetical protein
VAGMPPILGEDEIGDDEAHLPCISDGGGLDPSQSRRRNG